MTDLKALLERVEAATGPDDDLDAEVWLAIVPGASRKNLLADWPDEEPLWEYHDAERNTLFRAGLVPSLTASIDAALALVERVLPGAYGSVRFGSAPLGAIIIWDERAETAAGNVMITSQSATGEAATAPLAIVTALLNAKVSQP